MRGDIVLRSEKPPYAANKSLIQGAADANLNYDRIDVRRLRLNCLNE